MKVIAIVMLGGLLLIDAAIAQQRGPFGFGGFGPRGFGRRPGFMNGNSRGGYGIPANCPSVCPAIYTPTCGFNGICYRSFGNSCELSAVACNGQGSFQQVAISECSRPGIRTC